jgi:hypothetical protein
VDNKEEKKEEKQVGATQPVAITHSDEIIEAVAKMSSQDILKEDAGLKLLIAQYKEKCDENRGLQNKIAGANIKLSELSNKLAVAKERLAQIGGINVVLNIFNLIAGAILVIASSLPEGWIRKSLFAIAIIMFVASVLYYVIKGNQQKGMDEKKDTE